MNFEVGQRLSNDDASAFASQSLMVIKALDLDIAKVNPKGGAIALGRVASLKLRSVC